MEGTITIADVAYTLKCTSNKRQAIYIEGIFENTEPYNYDDIKEIIHIFLFQSEFRLQFTMLLMIASGLEPELSP